MLIDILRHISDKVDEVAKRKDVTTKEALDQLVKEGLEILKKRQKMKNHQTPIPFLHECSAR